MFDEENGVYHSVLVQGVLGLSERPVKSVMTPRPELEWLDLDADPAELKRTFNGNDPFAVDYCAW